jgi:hypothetical protein
MVLAMQQLGCGQAGAAVVGGMLSIAPNVFNGKWSALEEEIAKIQTTLGETIIDENVEKEKQLSEQNTAGQYLFCVSIDAGWNNRGSGKSYDSDSGHHITVGNRSGLVVALHYMSRRCAKCEIGELQDKDNPHDKSVCSRNYTGSSKGMEAHGALKSCLHLHLNRNVVWEIMVMDDDSSTQNLLRWNFAEAIDKQMMTEVPLTKGGNKREDKGQLPLSHPEITRLADHNHRNRCMAGKCYNLAYAKKSKSKCTTTDAERLKRNMTYALHQYKSEDYDTFKTMIWAVFFHHFNIHDTCGDWCRSLKHKDDPEELKKLYYRSKEKDSLLYEQLKEIWEVYCTDDALKEVHHEWHTNKCESMNQFITKFVRKSTYLCRTIVGKGRTFLAVGIDSIGYEDYYRALFDLLGLEYDETILNDHHQRLDKNKVRKRKYDVQPEVRRRQAAGRAVKIREKIRKLFEDKKAGKSYGSGMNDPSKKEAKAGSKNTNICEFCKKVGHSRKSSKKCLFTTWKPKKAKPKAKPGKFGHPSVVRPKYQNLTSRPVQY